MCKTCLRNNPAPKKIDVNRTYFLISHNKLLTYIRILNRSNKQLEVGRRLLAEIELRKTARHYKIVLAFFTVIIFVVVLGNGLFCMLPNKIPCNM